MLPPPSPFPTPHVVVAHRTGCKPAYWTGSGWGDTWATGRFFRDKAEAEAFMQGIISHHGRDLVGVWTFYVLAL